jgi:hypothetical protein
MSISELVQMSENCRKKGSEKGGKKTKFANLFQFALHKIK